MNITQNGGVCALCVLSECAFCGLSVRQQQQCRCVLCVCLVCVLECVCTVRQQCRGVLFVFVCLVCVRGVCK